MIYFALLPRHSRRRKASDSNEVDWKVLYHVVTLVVYNLPPLLGHACIWLMHTRRPIKGLCCRQVRTVTDTSMVLSMTPNYRIADKVGLRGTLELLISNVWDKQLSCSQQVTLCCHQATLFILYWIWCPKSRWDSGVKDLMPLMHRGH